MNCRELREYLFAFLDNELDAALSIEVQRHLEQCPECARECEIEHVVRKRLAQALQQVEDVPAFNENAIAKLLHAEVEARTGVRPESRRRLLTWAIRGSLAAALGIIVVVSVTRREGGGAEPASLADALVTDFERFIVEKKPLQIESGNAAEVSRWFQEQMALAVALPNQDAAVGTLLGGRQCKINRVPAAFAIYRLGDSLASVVALAESEQALSRMERVDRDGHTHWVDQCRGHTVVACRRGELIYAVVARLPEDVLTRLMPSSSG